MTERIGRPDGPHWTDGGTPTLDEYREWLKVPLPDGRKKSAWMYVDCKVCKHIRYDKRIYFHRANWWFWVRRGAYVWMAFWWWLLHPSCVQCRFNKKMGRKA